MSDNDNRLKLLIDRFWQHRWVQQIVNFVRRLRSRRSSQERRVFVRVSGTVRQTGVHSRPIFAATVLHPQTRNAVHSDQDGHFSLLLANVPDDEECELRIVSPNYWPKKVRVLVDRDEITIDPEHCSLDPIPDFFRKHIGVLLAYFGPKFLSIWYRSTLAAKALVVVLIFFLLPPICVTALDWGLPIPWTDFDEYVREQVQRVPFFPSRSPVVRYSDIRPRYLSGIKYELPQGTHIVNSEIVIEPQSELRLLPDTTLQMEKGASFFIQGALVANGRKDAEIKFEPKTPTTQWGNVTFFGEAARGSLTHCVIDGGHGKKITSSAVGRVEFDPSGQSVGGGLLIVDAHVSVADSIIRNCKARYGGGVYVRIHPGSKEPYSRFTNVSFEKCVAEDDRVAGGGAVFIKNAFPEFELCKFIDNQSRGEYSCGGAVYVGIDARTKLLSCTIRNNSADAEGGGSILVPREGRQGRAS